MPWNFFFGGRTSEDNVRNEVSAKRAALVQQARNITLSLDAGGYRKIPVGEEWNEVLDKVYLKEIAPYISHDKTTIIYMNAKKGAQSPLHRHEQRELVHLLSGKVQEMATGRVYSNAGDFFILAKDELHGLRFLEDSILILQWIPKLK